MSEKYKEVMDHVRLSDAARLRILDKVNASESKNRSFQWRQWGALAACLVVAIAGILVWHAHNPATPKQNPTVMAPSSIEEQPTLEALQAAMGFPVEDIRTLFPETAEFQFKNYFYEIAEITVQDGSQEIVFRKAAGSDDISGDYNVYAVTEKVEADGTTFTMQGNGDTVTVVLWQKGEYTYALSLTPGMAKEDVTALCTQILALEK